MRGIARSALQVFTWVPLQRWLLIIGLAMILAGQAAAFGGPDFIALGILTPLGLAIALIAPVMLGGMVLRALSAPRTLWLVPHGRLQLLLGILSAQLMMASVVTLIFTLMRWESPSRALADATPGPVFVGALGAGTALLFWMFIVVSDKGRYAAAALLAFLAGQRLFLPAMSQLRLSSVAPRVSALSISVALIAIAWVLFAVWYLRTRRFAPPLRGDAESAGWPAFLFSGALVRAGRQEALRTYLLGPLSFARIAAGVALLYASFLAFEAVMRMPLNGVPSASRPSGAFIFAPTICVLSGMAAFTVSRRAKALWLKGGYDRSDLFKVAERHAWRHFAAMGGTALVVSALVMWLLPQYTSSGIPMLLTQSVSGFSVLYLGLASIRNWCLADVLTGAGVVAFWGIELVCAVTGRAWTTLLPLIVAQIVLVLVLRSLAQRRWKHIDWIIHKPQRLSTQAQRPVVT